MDILIYIVIVISYYLGLYYLTKYISNFLTPLSKYLRVTILSFIYALLFGVGFLGSGGDPGFATPFPIILAGLYYVWKWSPWDLFINGVILPFLFWWLTIFIIIIIKYNLNNKNS